MSVELQPRRTSNRKKWKWSLSGAASIATILTLFITAGQSSNPPAGGGDSATPAASPSAAAFPVNVQSNFLSGCEVNGTQAGCQCLLSWFEQNVTLQQFEQDDALAREGVMPADLTSAERACG